MSRLAAFRYTAVPNRQIEARFSRHMGARRFAYNRCLQAVKEALDRKQADPAHWVPLSEIDLLNWFNG